MALDPVLNPGEIDAALWRALALPIEAATGALGRHDARLAALAAAGAVGVAEGAIARAHAFEAQALVGLLGGQAPLEDIVLNDAGMDARVPAVDVVKAVSLLAQRRSLARRKPDEVMSSAGLGGLMGVEAAPEALPEPPGRPPGFRPWDMPSPSQDLDEDDAPDDALPPLEVDDETPERIRGALGRAEALLARSRRPLASFNDLATPDGRTSMALSDPAYGEAQRFGAWRDALAAAHGLPAVLAAAAALDSWLVLEPSEHRGELGFLLAATLLRQRGLARHHMPALAFGHRRRRIRWSPHQPRRARLVGLLEGIAESARAGDADLDRLWLAREVMLRRCEGRSKNSRLPGLVELFIGSPLVTVQLAAARLGVTPQAVEAMLKELGSSLPREITGRKRYRAWGVL